ncbi:MAG TPA: hypothetical protein VK838_02620, partial [Candidatus Limnocylindrales bacterium]|nr:hypothetical protein [Candidatus Limnocylindrales bacterium]
YVDGVLVQTVDLYRGTLQNRRVVFRKRWSSSGSHTIMIKVTSKNSSSSGKRVDLDAYLTLN